MAKCFLRVGLLGPALLTCLLAGCKPSADQKLVGTWTFSDITNPPSAYSPDMLAKVRDAYRGKTMVFLPDQSFELDMPNAPIVGGWSMEGSSVKLTVKTVAGLSPEEYKKEEIGKLQGVNPRLAEKLKKQSSASIAFAGSLSADGHTLSVVTQGGKTGTLVFSKK